MRKHHELLAWQEAMKLVESIYRVTEAFPTSERFGLVSQMRRAAVSVPSNIAEGAARGSNAEFKHFLLVARGSLSELETQLLLAERLSLGSDTKDVHAQLNQTFALLGGLLKKMSPASPPHP